MSLDGQATVYYRSDHDAATGAERPPLLPSDPDWMSSLDGGGEMGARIRSFDWSSTPLGPIGEWPASLREAVSLCLRSRFQLAIYWGPQLTLLYNDAERDVLGALHPHALGRPATEILADMWDVVGPMLHGVLATGEATWSVDQPLPINRHGFLEEAFFTYSYSPIPDRGGIGGVLLVTFDTTERVLAERRLRTLRELAAETARARSADEACARAAGVLAGNPSDVPFCLLYLTDADGTPRLCASTGVAQTPDPDRWPLREVVLTQRAERVEDLAARLPGEAAAVSRAALVLPIIQADKGTAAGCLIVGVSDLRALDEAYRGFLDLVAGQIATAIAGARALEEERRRADALAAFNAAKTAFFANVSHEFRTPLTLLLAPLEDTLAQAGGALSAADRERLTVAHRNALRLRKLVNMLLEFSRIEAGRVQAVCEPTDLATFTAELASMFRSPVERAGMRLTVACPPLPRPVCVDREMWEKIVLNLLSNAFKFTLEGEIAVTLRQEGSEVELAVRDTGVGIPPEELPRLFERFHKVQGVRGRALEGTGIGLALVAELVKLHGGSIRAESTFGRGSTFIVSVPFATAPSAADADTARPAPRLAPSGVGPYVAETSRWLPRPAPAGAGPAELPESQEDAGATCPGQAADQGVRPCVLVADDNADMRQYLVRLLGGIYEVEEVADGQAALSAARERPPDLVLADVMMPQLDGFGLLRELRADPRTRTVPVVLVSARAGEESRVEGLAAGADDYLVKPFSARELLARVGAHLEMARVRREAARREDELRAEARRAQEQAAAILDSITDGFVALDRDWRFTHVNAAAERINGIRREDQIGKNQWELFPATRGTILESEWRRAVAEQVAVQFENYYEPWAKWFHIKAYPSKDGGLSVFYHEITARKRSEEALQKAHAELEQRVRERTRELSRVNARLGKQIARRQRVEEARTELRRHLVRAQEEEHRRIARELHDDLTQRLAVLAIDAGRFEQTPGRGEDVAGWARGMREQLAALSESVHSLSRQLHPSILDDLGLVDALRSECLSLGQRDGIAVKYHARDVPTDLPRDVALCFYRVAQEALRNVAHHAQCQRASVGLVANARGLVLCVRDRGIGFDLTAPGKTGLGLESIRERARLIQARLRVRSRPGVGTKITLSVPLKAKRAGSVSDGPPVADASGS
jgi:PAS domain S-box-containing protein